MYYAISVLKYGKIKIIESCYDDIHTTYLAFDTLTGMFSSNRKIGGVFYNNVLGEVIKNNYNGKENNISNLGITALTTAVGYKVGTKVEDLTFPWFNNGFSKYGFKSEPNTLPHGISKGMEPSIWGNVGGNAIDNIFSKYTEWKINKFEKISVNDKVSVDNVLPINYIQKEIPDFNKLPKEVQKKLMNDPANLQPMVNSSKFSNGCKVKMNDND